MQVFGDKNIIFNNLGFDTIRQLAHYQTFKNIIAKNGLVMQSELKNLPINPYIAQITQSLKNDPKNRYKKEAFKPIIEYVKISQGTGLSNYIIIVRNIPLLFDYASEHKKAKDTFCLLIYAGLHQPTKQINNEAIKFISKLLRRKTFLLLNCDVAGDFKDGRDVDYRRKEEFKNALDGVSDNSYIVKQNSLYCNATTLKNVDKILLYDKYKKQTIYQKQTLSVELAKWRRLELTLKPNGKTNFLNFVKSEFKGALKEYMAIAQKLDIKGLKGEYLAYQVRAIFDGRTLNKKSGRERFNSVQALASFITKQSASTTHRQSTIQNTICKSNA